MGTTRGVNKSFLRFFKDNWKHTRRLGKQGAVLVNEPYLQAICFQGRRQLKRKDNASQGFPLRYQINLCCHALSTSWLGDINPILCQETRQRLNTKKHPCLLWSANPCPNAVHMKPFSTSVFKILIWIIATTTKICTRNCFTQVFTTRCTTISHALLHIDAYELCNNG